MRRALVVPFVVASFSCCARAVPSPGPPPVPPVASAPAAQVDGTIPPLVTVLPPDAGVDDAAPAASIDATADDDPMLLHADTPEALRGLIGDAAPALTFPVGGGMWRFSQGNRAISRHALGRRACLEGLRDVVIQTAEQRARCGADAMVPVWPRGGSLETARTCIDVFEFPNKACELPFVFITPSQALQVCRAQGKRLCTQDEWNTACRGDPAGGADRVYAYGDDLDLTVCNTNKSRAHAREQGEPVCDVTSNSKLWTSCGTNTEPSGAFPRCRSRFGVFDQHGNVAEIMTRFEPADREVKSQLKGSAFFYVDVAKKPEDPGGYWTKYPDQCNFDPRWHVEKLEAAQHMNYHLGFRCCKSIELAAGDAGGGG
jgi:hypothetical protein